MESVLDSTIVDMIIDTSCRLQIEYVGTIT